MESPTNKLLDKLSEIIIYFVLIFSPWAFGTTENWSIWTINIAAFTLGFLLISKFSVNRIVNFKKQLKSHNILLNHKRKRPQQIQVSCDILLVFFMLLLLGYILLSAINASASFNLYTKEYTYFENYNESLPHSYDSKATWFLFWQYLGIFIFYWATCSWIRGAKSAKFSNIINSREKKILYLICINGGIIALESLLQRISYGNYNGKLLFLVEPYINNYNISQFGPFAYRSNAASYFNIIWPLSIGVFLQLSTNSLDIKKRRIGSGDELILIPLIILTASAPIISLSRGGALVMVGLLVLTALSLIFLNINSIFLRMIIPTMLILGIGSAYFLGWENLEPRIVNIFSDNLGSRSQIYNAISNMIKDYGFFGSGPGSFEAISQFEVGGELTRWESWAHSDYLEILLTFGKPGSAIIICIIGTLMIKTTVCFVFGRRRKLVFFGVLSIFGVACHAVADFPLQTHSILIYICIVLVIINDPYSYKLQNKTA